MELSKFCKRYGKWFILCEGKNLKDLEPYGFEPTYDIHTGELLSETLWIRGGLYGDRPVLEMSSKDIYTETLNRHCFHSILNPLRKFVMNFYDVDEEKRRFGKEKLKIEINRVDYSYFNVILDLIEDGIIKREN